MTGPEAIAAAERLLKDIDAKMMQTSADLDACRLLAASAQVMRALRAALLQSQEALQEVDDVLREAVAVVPDVMKVMEQHNYVFNRFPRDMKKQPPVGDGERWEAFAFSLYSRLAGISSHAESALREAALLSPPVAPKER